MPVRKAASAGRHPRPGAAILPPFILGAPVSVPRCSPPRRAGSAASEQTLQGAERIGAAGAGVTGSDTKYREDHPERGNLGTCFWAAPCRRHRAALFMLEMRLGSRGEDLGFCKPLRLRLADFCEALTSLRIPPGNNTHLQTAVSLKRPVSIAHKKPNPFVLSRNTA